MSLEVMKMVKLKILKFNTSLCSLITTYILFFSFLNSFISFEIYDILLKHLKLYGKKEKPYTDLFMECKRY